MGALLRRHRAEVTKHFFDRLVDSLGPGSRVAKPGMFCCLLVSCLVFCFLAAARLKPSRVTCEGETSSDRQSRNTQVDGGSRVIGPGDTGSIAPGEWIMEHEGIVHFGANEGDAPVVILASSLLEADEPPAIPIESPAPT